jgi:hypothetical protein
MVTSNLRKSSRRSSAARRSFIRSLEHETLNPRRMLSHIQGDPGNGCYVAINANPEIHEAGGQTIGDNRINSQDVLITTNAINRDEGGPIDLWSSYPFSLDTNGDHFLSPVDVLIRINAVNTDGNSSIEEYRSRYCGGDPQIAEAVIVAEDISSDTIPKGALTEMLKFTVTSGDDPTSLYGFTLLHAGLGHVSDIEGVALFEGDILTGTRVTRVTQVDNEDQTVDLRLNDTFVVAPYESQTFTAVIDFQEDAQTRAEHSFILELPSDINADQPISGIYPFQGPTMEIAAVNTGVVYAEYKAVNPSEVNVGDTDVVVGSVTIFADSTEDQTLYAATFENIGTTDQFDLQNLALRRTDGTVLTTMVPEETLNGFTKFQFDPPFTILEGDKTDLEVITSVAGGASDYARMHFEEEMDIFAVGSLFGYGINGQTYGSSVVLPAESTTLPQRVYVSAGEVSFEINGPPAGRFSGDDNDIPLAIVEITAPPQTFVDDLFFQVTAKLPNGNPVPEFIHLMAEDLEIRNTVTGRTHDATRLTGGNDFGIGRQIYRLDDFFVGSQPIETWELRFDAIENGPTQHFNAGDRVRAEFCTEPANTIGSCIFTDTFASSNYNALVENGQGDQVFDLRPGGLIAGNWHTKEDATLLIVEKSLGERHSAVGSQKDKVFGRAQGVAGSSEDVLVTDVTWGIRGNSADVDSYQLLFDTDGDGNVDTVADEVASYFDTTLQMDVVEFSDIFGGGLVSTEDPFTIELRGDISNEPSDQDFQVTLLSVGAEELDDGTDLSTGQVTIINVDQPIVDFSPNGTIEMNLDSFPIQEGYIGLGDTVPIGRLNLLNDIEPIDVTKLVISLPEGSSVSIRDLPIHIDGGGRLVSIGAASIAACGSDPVLAGFDNYCFLSETEKLVVDGEVELIVSARANDDQNGGIPDQIVQMLIDGLTIVNPATRAGSLLARGATSANNLGPNDTFIGTTFGGGPNTDILGPQFVTAGAYFSNVRDRNPDPDESAVPTGISTVAITEFTAANLNNSRNGQNRALLPVISYLIGNVDVDIRADSLGVFDLSDQTMVETSYTIVELDGSPFTGTDTIDHSVRVLFEVDTDRFFSTYPGSFTRVGLQMDITNPNNDHTDLSILQIITELDGKSFQSEADAAFESLERDLWSLDDVQSTTYRS